MKNSLTKASLLALPFAFAFAATAGVLDNAWLKGTTDKNPISYAPGEEMVFTITPMGLDGDIPEGEYTLKWTFTDDFGRKEEGSQPLTAEPFVYRTSLDQPGFVRLQAFVHGPDGKRYSKKYTGDTTTPEGRKAMNKFEEKPHFVFFDGGAAVEPEKLGLPVEPADFDEFWAKQYKRLDAVPIKVLEQVEIPQKNPKARLFAVSIACAEGIRPVTGYLSIPTAVDEGKKFPARLQTHGYSGNPGFHLPGEWYSSEEIVLNINAHGMKLPAFGATDEDLAALKESIRSNGKSYGFDPEQNKDPETAYFNGMVLRVKRALQFLKALPAWNGKDLRASGGSQGGLQTIWAAGCGEGVNSASSDITWCCDLPMNQVRLEKKASSAGWYIPWVDALGYYDAVNFAKRIPQSCQVKIPRAGLGDYTCPPMGLAKLWNAIHKGNKSIRWVQGSQHGYTPPEYEGRDTWVKED